MPKQRYVLPGSVSEGIAGSAKINQNKYGVEDINEKLLERTDLLRVAINEMQICYLQSGYETGKYFIQMVFDCLKEILPIVAKMEKVSDTTELVAIVKDGMRAVEGGDFDLLCRILQLKLITLLDRWEEELGGNRENEKKDLLLLSDRFNNNLQSTLHLNATSEKAKMELLEKINLNHYPHEKISCLCGNDKFTIIAEKDRYGIPVTTCLCQSCGLLVTNPRMTQEAYDEFYSLEYRRLYSGDGKSSKAFFDEQLAHGELIYNYIGYNQLRTDKPRKILEIGCGAGGILKAFQNNGFDVVGVDLGEDYLKYGRNEGLTLYNGHASALIEAHEHTFDLIILSHVLEHFLDIEKELETIRKLLAKDGMVYIEVPGIKNIQGYRYDFLLYFQNAHTYHFTLNTLRQLMESQGFAFVGGNELIMSVFTCMEEKTTKSEAQYRIKNYYWDLLHYMQIIEQNFHTNCKPSD